MTEDVFSTKVDSVIESDVDCSMDDVLTFVASNVISLTLSFPGEEPHKEWKLDSNSDSDSRKCYTS